MSDLTRKQELARRAAKDIGEFKVKYQTELTLAELLAAVDFAWNIRISNSYNMSCYMLSVGDSLHEHVNFYARHPDFYKEQIRTEKAALQEAKEIFEFCKLPVAEKRQSIRM